MRILVSNDDGIFSSGLVALGGLKERLTERLGEALYRIFIEAYNPFGAAEVVEEVEPQHGHRVPE